MKKVNVSIYEICKKDVKKQTSFLYSSESSLYECPVCHKKTFIINNQYDIGYCTNKECNCFADFFSKRKKDSILNLEKNSLSPIPKESLSHINNDNMLKEKVYFSLTDNLLKKYYI